MRQIRQISQKMGKLWSPVTSHTMWRTVLHQSEWIQVLQQILINNVLILFGIIKFIKKQYKFQSFFLPRQIPNIGKITQKSQTFMASQVHEKTLIKQIVFP